MAGGTGGVNPLSFLPNVDPAFYLAMDPNRLTDPHHPGAMPYYSADHFESSQKHDKAHHATGWRKYWEKAKSLWEKAYSGDILRRKKHDTGSHFFSHAESGH